MMQQLQTMLLCAQNHLQHTGKLFFSNMHESSVSLYGEKIGEKNQSPTDNQSCSPRSKERLHKKQGETT